MKFLYALFLMLLPGSSLIAQTYYPLIDSLTNQVNLDSLNYHVRNLSGEDSCKVNGKALIIKNRISSTGNDLAANYIKEQLQRYGLKIIDQKYSSGGRNIIAEQKGTLFPDKKYILSSHYDAVANYCADDNVSGGSATLEAVRHLSKFLFKHTIVYAFWDEEETGLNGSKYYAAEAKKNGDQVLGVLNMEMLGYDSDNDFLFEIHTKPVAGSVALADKLVAIENSYKLKLKPIVKNPGTDRSDHASFWNNGFSALTFSQAFFSGDSNPAYHKATDRIGLFNFPYYHELSKLGLAAIATLAEPHDVINNTGEINSTFREAKLLVYPNPAQNQITIKYFLPSDMVGQLEIYNPLNHIRIELINKYMTGGDHQYNLNTSGMTPGIYFVVLRLASEVKAQKLVIQN